MMKRKKLLYDISFAGGKAMTNRLRDTRVLKRITQFQLRLQTGINATKISFIENGLVEPREDEKRKLSRALGVNLQEIFPVEKKNGLSV
jgi:transcriptional regulator with XRE-family HTH domain